MEFGVICFWLLFCILVAKWAGDWGRSSGVYFFASLICSPLIGALILLVEGRNTKKVEEHAVASGDSKKCPFCAELVKREATKCRYCGSEIPPEKA